MPGQFQFEPREYTARLDFGVRQHPEWSVPNDDGKRSFARAAVLMHCAAWAAFRSARRYSDEKNKPYDPEQWVLDALEDELLAPLSIYRMLRGAVPMRPTVVAAIFGSAYAEFLPTDEWLWEQLRVLKAVKE